MNQLIIIGITITIALVVTVVIMMIRPGYRGAIGFKNRYASEIDTLKLLGFSKQVDCRTLAESEHSFNYLGRQDIPDEVQISWNYVGDSEVKNATVSLSGVPKDLADGEIFFVLSGNGDWLVEHAPQLQLDKL